MYNNLAGGKKLHEFGCFQTPVSLTPIRYMIHFFFAFHTVVKETNESVRQEKCPLVV